jgi:Rps23 Pro-64 3,4-dihydroxylase Tpa1-like proline 4-hydroxylase
MCEKIISYYNHDLQDSVITDPVNPINKNIRNCTTKNILYSNTFGETILVNYIKYKLMGCLKKYLETFPYCNATEFSQLDILCYKSNNYKAGYKFHVDFGPSVSNRHLSISVCLNNDYKGGEFVFHQPGSNNLIFPQNIGDVIIFPSSFMFPHQVNKIEKGTRFALVGWAI